MIRLSLADFRADVSPAALAALRAEFAEYHTLQIREFLDPALMALVLERIQPEEFQTREHGKIGLELSVPTKQNIGVQILSLRLNDERVRHFMETVTGIVPLKHFEGRIYRMAPGTDHYDSWHDDLANGRQLGISINLSPEPYRGGTFRIKYFEGEIIRPMPNLGAGDAIFFRIDDRLMHMVTKMEGEKCKTAFAGWFHDELSLGDCLRRPAAETAAS